LIDVPPIINSSGFKIAPHRHCPNLKQGNWYAIDLAMTGDAPKDFLGIYEYGVDGCKRAKRKSWPRYIAKVGQKWYPNESITEHLITRIGQALKLNVAESRLVHVRGQLRFLSRYFLSGSEYLLHGADIFASYLEDHDKEFVQGIEDEGKSPEYFVLERNPGARDDVDMLAGIDAEPVDLVRDLLKGEFSRLISPLRQTWICRLMEYRTEQFRLVLKGEATDA